MASNGTAATFFTFVMGIGIFFFSYTILYDHFILVLPEVGASLGMYPEHIDLFKPVVTSVIALVFLGSMVVAGFRDAMYGDSLNLLRTTKAGICALVILFIVFIAWMVTTPLINETLFPMVEALSDTSTIAASGAHVQVRSAHKFIFSVCVAIPIFIIGINPFVYGRKNEYDY